MKHEIAKLTTRQKQALETRQRLLEASLTVFLENGFQKATISQIIKKAKTGYGTAYVYFQNKDEIFMELMEHVMEKFYEVAKCPFEPKTKKEAYDMIQHQVRLFLNLAVQERKIMKVVKEAIGVSPIIEKKWQEIRERFIKRITEDIQYSQQNKLAKTDLNSNLVARAWCYANEMFMWELVNQEESSIDEIVLHLTTMYTSGLYV
ncbi:TetR/AcrR family transcriptional regulator [Aneurinibacillus thermoaerophilus]|uniref:TetR/AcrR family transcriptional regulator n=1 Tax=Aneurinibacillus thermoaerophilus TaxID=143495 RepID=UPI002E1C09B1|nr:TetR/AcrR family transcriptional regulator [Aneurinibacillus thermoaerophilus]MED0763529.1 TetR/AcrR family transcriptional regulator [Aneurinibacillus thermoaerophilus]